MKSVLRLGRRNGGIFCPQQHAVQSISGYSICSDQPRPSSSPEAPDEKKDAQHWLDRRFPAASSWLEKQNRIWWTESIKARCRQYAQLHGREDAIAQLLEMKYDQLLKAHQIRAADPRAEIHVQSACLAVATHQVLGAWIKDSQELSKIVAENMGSHTSPGLRFLLKASLWLTRNPYAQTTRRLRGLSLDYGPSFRPSLDIQDRVASLQLESCIYKDIFEAEHVLHLLPTSCCSQDRIWFEGLESWGVRYERSKWLGQSDQCCCLKIEHVAPS